MCSRKPSKKKGRGRDGMRARYGERGDREIENTQAPKALEEELVLGATKWMKSTPQLSFLLDSLAKERTCYIVIPRSM